MVLLLNIKEKIPDEEIYLKIVKALEHNHLFFDELYKSHKNKIKIKEKKILVEDSIKTFLDTFGHWIDLDILTKFFIKKDTKKIYLLWNPIKQSFNIDRMTEDDLTIIGVKEVTKNTIIVQSKNPNTTHKLNLTWRNNIGCLNPSWHVSTKRLV